MGISVFSRLSLNLLWLALGQPREAGSVRNWEPAKWGWGAGALQGMGAVSRPSKDDLVQVW